MVLSIFYSVLLGLMVWGIIGAFITSRLPYFLKLALVLIDAMGVGFIGWDWSAERGEIGSPLALSPYQHYQVAAVNVLATDSIVILVHQNGEASSCEFKNKVTLPIGSYCKVGRQEDGSLTLIPY